MGGAVSERQRRGVVFAAVLALHAVLIALAALGLHRHAQAPVEESLTTWIALPSPAAQIRPLPSARSPAWVVRPIPLEPPPMEAIQIPPEDASRTTDWALEARQAAAATLNRPKPREFVNPASALPPPSHSSGPAHRAGDQERDPFGNVTVWVNDHCYVRSEAPPLGTPDVFARMATTTTTCIATGPPAGELFKDLPAYKKYHPQ